MTTMIHLPQTLEGKSSPWGKIDHVTPIALGICAVSTPSHGGIKLDRLRNSQVPDYMRAEGGWYEEDCDWSIPGVVFAAEFDAHKAGTSEAAKETLKNWHPDHYQRFYGVTLKPEESFVLGRRTFDAEHANDWVVVAAWGQWHNAVPEGWVGVSATLGGQHKNSVEHRYFLVPDKEYAERRYAFVVDLARHPGWTNHP